MNAPWGFYLNSISGAALCALLARLLWTVTPETLPRREAWTRHRIWGLVIGYAVLIPCVPLARVVSPYFLLPLLWPLALISPVVCAFYVDYPNARAIGGALILVSYFTVHYTFDLRLPAAPALTVLAWLVGVAGIWLSAQPWKLRDWFRAGRRFRRIAAAVFALFALALAGEALWRLC